MYIFDNPIDLKNWMSNLPESLHFKPLSEIAIPGSHNSFSYDLKPNAGICKSSTSIAIYYLGWLPFVKRVIHRWSVTQSLLVIEQLERGVRYLDIRSAAQTINGIKQVFSVHCLYGSPLSIYLDQISEFLKNNPKEILILDFNHFYDIDNDCHVSIVEDLFRRFGNSICPCSDITEITLNYLWKHNYKVIIIYHCQCDPPIINLWPDSSLKSDWPNLDTTGSLINYLNKEVVKAKNMNHKFFVYQGILTPTTSFIMKNLRGTIKNRMAIPTANVIVNWVKTFSVSERANIFILDFMELQDFSSAVIYLNLAYIDKCIN